LEKELPSITDAFDLFVVALNEGRYYDAHEDLEAIWFPRRFEDDDEVRLWKGFINAAVSFELIKKGRPLPAKKVWGNYQKYLPLLGTFETSHYEMYVKIANLIQEKYEEYTYV
jgi:hypothetical protein